MPLKTHTVKQGETLSKIARDYGVGISDITGYRSGDPNKIFSGETINIGAEDPQPVNRINASELQSTTALAAPPQPTPTKRSGLQTLADSTAKKIEGLGTSVNQDEEEVRSIYTQLGSKSKERVESYASEETVFGTVNQTQKDLNDINSKIRQKENAYNRRREKVLEENPTGQLSEGQQIALDKLDREWAREAADLSIIAEAKLGNFEGAKGIVDDRIDAETEDLRTRLEGLSFFYSNNYNRLSDLQKTQLQQETAIVEGQIADIKELENTIGELQIEAARNGAPSEVISRIGRAEDKEGAITAAGQYGGLLERQREARLGSDGENDTTDITPEDERTLTGAGFTTADIEDLPRAIADFGIDAVIESMDTEEKKAAVRKVYNVKEEESKFTKDSIDQKVTQKYAVDKLESRFTNEQLIEIARGQGFAKWYRGKDAELEAFLKSDKARQYYVNLLVEEARKAGRLQE